MSTFTPEPCTPYSPTWEEQVLEMGIPQRCLANFPKFKNSEGDPWYKVGKLLWDRLGTGMLVALVGKSGVGKSMIGATLVQQRFIQKKEFGHFCEATDFFLDLKSTYRTEYTKGEVNERAVVHRYRRYPLLVIDEVDKRSESAWEDRMLLYLINKRYSDMSDTVLIANLSKSGFEAAVGDAMVSRLNETGGLIECDWPSFRD